MVWLPDEFLVAITSVSNQQSYTLTFGILNFQGHSTQTSPNYKAIRLIAVPAHDVITLYYSLLLLGIQEGGWR
jgi:hypothetical protein